MKSSKVNISFVFPIYIPFGRKDADIEGAKKKSRIVLIAMTVDSRPTVTYRGVSKQKHIASKMMRNYTDPLAVPASLLRISSMSAIRLVRDVMEPVSSPIRFPMPPVRSPTRPLRSPM